LKQKAIPIILLAIMSIAVLAGASSFQVSGQSLYGLTIFYVTAQGGYESLENVTVGQQVALIGSMVTSNGTYNIYYADQLVDSGQASGYYVSANFTVPPIVAGQYNFVLNDVAANRNTTYSLPLLISYSITPIISSPTDVIQEGSTIGLNVTIAGATANTQYTAVIQVDSPSGTDSYNKTITLTSSSVGTATTQVNYPDSSFSSGATSIYAGTYTTHINATEGLAQGSFVIGFTDKSQYHRQDPVQVRAVGYQPNQAVTMAILINDVVFDSANLSATDQGIVSTTWTVPQNAAVGTYTITLSAQTNPSKAIADIQTFNLPGYYITFKALNLASEPVSDLVVEAVDQSTNNAYNSTTYSDGLATTSLETGDVTVNAYWNDVKVGSSQVTISGNGTYTVNCELTNLIIKVQDKNGVVIPFTNLNVTYQYTTNGGITQSGNATGQTDLSGVYVLNSTLPGITYNVAASKYSTVFNSGNGTISNIPTQPTVQASILCPDESLGLTVVDFNNAALTNARVTLIEQTSGLFYTVSTDSSGAAQLQVTFGQYRVSIYSSDNILLNETVVDVLSSTNSHLQAALYNLHVSVKVVDYFGNPIGNVNVELSRPGMQAQTATTPGSGTVSFNNIVGGNMEVVANVQGNQDAYIATNLQVNSPTTVTLKMDKFVAVGGALMSTSLLASIIIIILVVVLLIVVEVLRKINFKLPRRISS
jgi:hypothetical protein